MKCHYEERSDVVILHSERSKGISWITSALGASQQRMATLPLVTRHDNVTIINAFVLVARNPLLPYYKMMYKKPKK